MADQYEIRDLPQERFETREVLDEVYELSSGGERGPRGEKGDPGDPAADLTAEEILALLLTADGSGSELDADLLDGHNSDYFATQDDLDNIDLSTKVSKVGDDMTGQLSITPSTSVVPLELQDHLDDDTPTQVWRNADGSIYAEIRNDGFPGHEAIEDGRRFSIYNPSGASGIGGGTSVTQRALEIFNPDGDWAVDIDMDGSAAFWGSGSYHNKVIRFTATGDAYETFIIAGDGSIQWGDGTSLSNRIELYRTAADELTIDDFISGDLGKLKLGDATGDTHALNRRTADARYVNNGETAGGVLGGTYPNPTFAVDMATQAELDAEALARSNADALLIPLSQKAANNGVATLDSGGKVPSAQLPAIAISETFPVASQAAMLVLSAQQGDVAIRTDLNKSFILSTNSPSTLADWKELLTPTDAVSSVNGRAGAVTGLAEQTSLDTEITNRTIADALKVAKAGDTMTGNLVIDQANVTVDGTSGSYSQLTDQRLAISDDTTRLVYFDKFGMTMYTDGVDADAKVVLSSALYTDSNDRFKLHGSGKQEWGDGTGAVDTNLYRSAANVLKTDDTFDAEALTVSDSGDGVSITPTEVSVGNAGGYGAVLSAANFTMHNYGNNDDLSMDTQSGLLFTSADTTNFLIRTKIIGESANHYQLTSDGAMAWGPGIIDNPDVTLAREDVGVLRTQILRVSDPVGDDDAVNKGYLDTALGGIDLSDYVAKAGDTMDDDAELTFTDGSGTSVELSPYNINVVGSGYGYTQYAADGFTTGVTDYIANSRYDGFSASRSSTHEQVTGTIAGGFAYFAADDTKTSFRSQIWNESHPRVSVQSDGKILFGDGTYDEDVNLYWGAADLLKTDDWFDAGGLSILGDAVATEIYADTKVDKAGDTMTGQLAIAAMSGFANGGRVLYVDAGDPTAELFVDPSGYSEMLLSATNGFYVDSYADATSSYVMTHGDTSYVEVRTATGSVPEIELNDSDGLVVLSKNPSNEFTMNGSALSTKNNAIAMAIALG